MTMQQNMNRLGARGGRLFARAALVGCLACTGVGGAWAQPADAQGDPAAAAPPPVTPATVLADARERAVEIVLAASRSEDPRARAAAIEAIQPDREQARALALRGMQDDNPGVRFAALVTIGQLQLESLGPAALDYADDENLSVRGAAVFAAHRCGQDVGPQLSILARMLGSQTPGVRGNAAMLLGMLGDEGALPMLHEMAAMPMPRVDPTERIWLELQFAEAMLRLDPDDEEMLGVLRSSVYSTIDDVRVLALRVVGEVGDQSMAAALESLIDGEDPIQIRIAASRTLAQLGSRDGRRVLLTGASFSSADVLAETRLYLRAHRNNSSREAVMMRELAQNATMQADLAADVRAQSAFGLGELRDLESTRKLVVMLDDPHPIVQLAAAAAVLDAHADE